MNTRKENTCGDNTEKGTGSGCISKPNIGIALAMMPIMKIASDSTRTSATVLVQSVENEELMAAAGDLMSKLIETSDAAS